MSIRHKPMGWLAIFTFDEQFGDITIQSDWGTWSYIWQKSGRGTDTLSQFLMSCDTGYLMDKFSYGTDLKRHFYADETVEKMKKEIVNARKHRSTLTMESITKEEAREAWNAVEDAEANYSTDMRGFVESFELNDAIKKIWGEEYWYDPPIITGWEPSYKMFFEKIWPLFIQHLKGEPLNVAV